MINVIIILYCPLTTTICLFDVLFSCAKRTKFVLARQNYNCSCQLQFNTVISDVLKENANSNVLRKKNKLATFATVFCNLGTRNTALVGQISDKKVLYKVYAEFCSPLSIK